MLEILLEKGRPDFNISERSRQILRDQEIYEDRPGTVLTDFETLLHFIGNDGLKTTGKYYLLPQSRLDELNLQMSRPVMHRLKRPQQRSFPHLHGLYLMLRHGTGKARRRAAVGATSVMSWRLPALLAERDGTRCGGLCGPTTVAAAGCSTMSWTRQRRR